MTLETTLERSLKIKLGALKRLKKDYDFSIAESKEAEDLVQLKIVQNCDDATINHQKEVLKDHEKSIIDARNRLENALKEFEDFYGNLKKEVLPGSIDPELSREALERVEDANALLKIQKITT